MLIGCRVCQSVYRQVTEGGKPKIIWKDGWEYYVYECSGCRRQVLMKKYF